jgi:hypothetical protein
MLEFKDKENGPDFLKEKDWEEYNGITQVNYDEFKTTIN